MSAEPEMGSRRSDAQASKMLAAPVKLWYFRNGAFDPKFGGKRNIFVFSAFENAGVHSFFDDHRRIRE